MKSEARNSKQIRISRMKISKQRFSEGLEHSGFEFVSGFDIRISSLAINSFTEMTGE